MIVPSYAAINRSNASMAVISRKLVGSYESIDEDGETLGDGLEIFSLDEIKEHQEIEYLSEHGIPIAHLLNDCYLIDLLLLSLEEVEEINFIEKESAFKLNF
ncbi:hypothetical protein [Peribacillus frigoritolerans]|uniref:hypothetical protein n=1 Tax=Peribacillus frigoritolerans TaxID=450367 RepID=UPI00399CE5CF